MISPSLLDGRPASAAELASLAFAGHAHFTAMQVRGGGVRGLDLHLQRLRHASLTLFDTALDDGIVRQRIAEALTGEADLSLTATVFARSGEFAGDDGSGLSVLVRSGPPSSGPAGPLRLMMVRHDRWMPSLKHVGEGAKTHYLRRALDAGFDDAVFADQAGHLLEATIWNLAFWDGESVVWPVGEMLVGTTMGILQRQLAAAGVPQRAHPVDRAALQRLGGAVVMNSWSPGIPVSAIDGTRMPGSDALASLLSRAFAAEPLVRP